MFLVLDHKYNLLLPISVVFAVDGLYSSAKDLHLITCKKDAFLPVMGKDELTRPFFFYYNMNDIYNIARALFETSAFVFSPHALSACI